MNVENEKLDQVNEELKQAEDTQQTAETAHNNEVEVAEKTEVAAEAAQNEDMPEDADLADTDDEDEELGEDDRRGSRRPMDRDLRNSRESRGNRGPRRNRRGRDRDRRGRDERRDKVQDKVIHIGRVAKTVKGGRNIRFTALVIAGDGEGNVGKGHGKSAEIPDAIRKGCDSARKNMFKVPLSGTTIPHEVLGVFGGGKVLLKPAPEGTGVIAGGPIRAICDMCGIKDVRTKSLGSNNPNNMVNAAFDGLKQLMSMEDVAKKRGKSVDELK